jgi:hypothetical protein
LLPARGDRSQAVLAGLSAANRGIVGDGARTAVAGVCAQCRVAMCAVRAGISQQVLVCTKPVCAYSSPSRRAVRDLRRDPPGHAACRPQAWCPGNSGSSTVRPAT